MSKKPQVNPVIVDAIRGRGPLGHSTLYWWMWDHFYEIDAARSGRPDWVTATAEFSKMGFKGRQGAELKKENVRKTWTRVVGDRKKASTPPAAGPSTPDHSSVRMIPVTSLKPNSEASSAQPGVTVPEVEKRLADFQKSMIPDWERKKKD